MQIFNFRGHVTTFRHPPEAYICQMTNFIHQAVDKYNQTNIGKGK